MKINLILAVNGGSSSIKLALYEAGETLKLTVKAEMENIGMRDTKLTFTTGESDRKHQVSVEAADHQAAMNS